MKNYVSPKPEDLAKKIHAGVTAHYQPSIKSIDSEITKSQQQIQVYTSNLDSLTSQRDAIRSDLAELNDQLASIAPLRASYPSRLEEARRDAATKRSQVDDARSRERQAELSVADAQRRLDSLREPVDDGRYEFELEQWKQEISRIDSRISEIESERNTARQEQESLRRQIANLGSDEASKRSLLEREARKQEMIERDCDRRINNHKDEKAHRPEPVDDGHYKRELELYKAEKKRLESDLSSAKNDLSDASSSVSSAKSALYSSENDVDELLDEPAQLDALERQLPVQISDLEDSLEDTNKNISEYQKQIGLWKQELATQTANKKKVKSQQASDAKAKSDRFLQSSYSQTVLSWHRITDNMAKNRKVWNNCIQQVAREEDKMWAERVLPKHAQAYNALVAEKKVNEANRAKAHSVLDAQNDQLNGIVQSYLQLDSRNRWALHDDDSGNNDIFEPGRELERIHSYLSTYGSNPSWNSQTLIAVRTKPMVAFWILLVLAAGCFFLPMVGIDIFGLGIIFAAIFAVAAIGSLVSWLQAKSNGTNVTWAEEQRDWSVVAQALRNANDEVNRYEQKAQQITAQSKQIQADNKREVAQIRVQTTVANVSPHINKLVPGFCIFSAEDKKKVEQFCAAVTKGFIARGASDEQLNLSIGAFPIPPKVPYSGDDEFVKKAIALYEQKKVR